MKSYIIQNKSGGPWKLKFKNGTPIEIMQSIPGVLKSGKTIRTSVEVSKCLNEMHLEVSKNRGVINYTVLEVNTMGPPPVTKLLNKAPKKGKKTLKKVTPKKEIKEEAPDIQEKIKEEPEKGKEDN